MKKNVFKNKKMSNELLAGFHLDLQDGEKSVFVTISTVNTKIPDSIVKTLSTMELLVVRLLPDANSNLFIWISGVDNAT